MAWDEGARDTPASKHRLFMGATSTRSFILVRMPLCRVKLRSSGRNLNLPLLGKSPIGLQR